MSNPWNNKKFDWKGLDDALTYIVDFLRTYGRINCWGKEKYGSLRISCYFEMISIHSLLYPNAYSVPKDTRFWEFDEKYISPILYKLFDKPFKWWQHKVYNMAYQRALNKWPHLRAEILVDADHIELISGVWRVVDNTTYIFGWKGEVIGSWTNL